MAPPFMVSLIRHGLWNCSHQWHSIKASSTTPMVSGSHGGPAKLRQVHK
jgi:hypothetical protein